VQALKRKGATPAFSLKELTTRLPKQKIVWIMIPAGKPVDETLSKLLPCLKKDDIVIDGGNSYYRDSIRRHQQLKKKGIHFLDVGVSGGIQGARHGACMMVGGEKKVFRHVEELFKDLCVENGYAYVGKNGAGHLVKAVHNGIEYGMMGALGEGMQALYKHKKKFALNLKEIAKVYAHGSIIEGRLAAWMNEAFRRKKFLDSVSGKVPRGETKQEMKKLLHVSEMPILRQAIRMRVQSRKKPSFSGKIVAVLRNLFGGHRVNKR
jgi:6-phosphogluconate dehydrogenase